MFAFIIFIVIIVLISLLLGVVFLISDINDTLSHLEKRIYNIEKRIKED